MKAPTIFLILALVLLSASAVSASDYPEVPVDLTPIQLSAHSYYVQGGTGIATDNYGFVSNAAFVVTSEGLVVFDTLGTPALGHHL